MIQDRAALSVATEFELDQEACDMHDISKISRSAIGDLVRTKNKQTVNPFPRGRS